MNPLIIFGIIIGIVIAIWAGISSAIYNETGVNIPWLSFIPKFPIDFSKTEIPNLQLNETNTSLPIDEWISTAPMKEIWDNIWDGTRGILEWLTNVLNGIITWMIHLVSPTTQIPSYMGVIIFWLIVLLFIFLAWTHLEGLILKIITILLVIIFVVFTLIIILLLLHLI